MENFFKTSIKSLGRTGIIFPSSKLLIKKMINKIDFEQGRLFVEFGTGDGCLTEALLTNMTEDSILLSFELNTDFFSYSAEKFLTDKRIRIYNENALNFDNINFLRKDVSIDYIVSSLPLTLFKDENVDILLSKVKSRLKPNGMLFQYQYSLIRLSYFKRIFRKVDLDYALLNIPPAFIYSCSN